MHYLYHITDKNDINEGYVGVTNSPTSRWKNHCKSDFTIGIAIRNNQWTFDENFKILFSGSAKKCYSMEETLRPNSFIGLNEAVGGKGGYTTYTKERASKISKALRGRTFSTDHKNKLKQIFSDGRRKGKQNGRAIKRLLIDPNGNEHNLQGNFYQFCEEYELLWSSLWYYKGQIVPEVKKGTLGGFRAKSKLSLKRRNNTSGWRLKLY